MKCHADYDTELGKLTLEEEDGALTRLEFGQRDLPGEARETPLLQEAHRQLKEYLAGKRTAFDLPLKPQGTPFQQAVWKALLDIPYGQTATYGQIAAKVGNPKACRAVGMANNRNPIAVIIPCHRVIGADGGMTGYGGGLPIKRMLLDLENGHLTI